jgi:hypothetical protein
LDNPQKTGKSNASTATASGRLTSSSRNATSGCSPTSPHLPRRSQPLHTRLKNYAQPKLRERHPAPQRMHQPVRQAAANPHRQRNPIPSRASRQETASSISSQACGDLQPSGKWKPSIRHTSTKPRSIQPVKDS